MTMKQHNRIGFTGAIVLVLSWLVAAQSHAGLFDATTAAPSQTTAAFGRTNSAIVTWQITSSSVLDANMTIKGVRGEFLTPSNAVLGVVNVPLPVRSVFLPKGVSVVTAFTESVIIPPYVLDSARAQGLTQIFYSRIFSATDVTNSITTSGSGLLTISIGSSSGGILSIGRQALSFDDGEVRRVVGKGARLQAQASLNAQGSGLLRAAWEIAEPPSTLGTPVYRLLQPVQQYFSGSQEVNLRSPLLPTRDGGTYLVRLRIVEPEPAFSSPEIAYAVEESVTTPAEALKVLAPTGVVRVDAQTRFEWQAVRNAKFYRLEIYNQDVLTLSGAQHTPRAATSGLNEAAPGRLVTGVVLPDTQTHTLLSAATRRHLQSGHRYVWLIQGIDGNGRVIAISAQGELIAP